jgi:hypothetical protein
MRAKPTSKNQLILPETVVMAVGATEYFDVDVHEGQIVLTPVRVQRGDAVRAKLSSLGLAEADMADAVRWARTGATAQASAASRPAYGTGTRRAQKAPVKKTTARRK